MADNFKPLHSSTVFACDLSSDTRYIRCDFPQCSEHVQEAKPSWILNTLKNVRTLEYHVAKEIDGFMKVQSLQCVFSDSVHKRESKEIICAQKLPTGTKKVLAVFSLKDSQSQLGDWLSKFLDAAFLSECGNKRKDFVVVTQDFLSRLELMKSIANLEFLKFYIPKVEVICILSCHSSSQGQVFSCTPTDISKLHGFEEFCSLHDFTLACQDALEEMLSGIHISSCFTLKLDCSHLDWPVDSTWFKSKLKCQITGSVKEVYETGSQICDLHLILSTILSSPIAPSSCKEQLQRAVSTAQTDSFPDLALEMGLETLKGEIVESRLQHQGVEDQVSPPILVESEVFVALLVGQEANNEDQPSPSVSLSQAISANLFMRQESDIRCSHMVLSVKIDKVSSVETKASLREKLNEIPVNNNCKVLFVALSPFLANPSAGLTDAVRAWSISRGGNKVYGIHFQEISALQAYYIKNRLKEEVELFKHNKNLGENKLEHIAITGLVDAEKRPQLSYPVLLYLIHLAIGENGYRQLRKRMSTGVYSKKPLTPGTSHWTLEEVYIESCHVLSGLARKCSLQVLSLPDNSNGVDSKSSDQVSIPICSTVDDKVLMLQTRPSSTVGLGTREAGTQGNVRGPSNVVTNVFQSILENVSQKRPFEKTDGEVKQQDSKNLHVLSQSTKGCDTKTLTNVYIDTCSLSSTTDKSSGANKLSSFKDSSSMKSSCQGNQISNLCKFENEDECRQTNDVILVIDESDDDISSCNSNSKGIQADFEPLNPSKVFYNNLRSTGTSCKRLNDEELDSFVSNESEKRFKKKKRKDQHIIENNQTMEHFPAMEIKGTTPVGENVVSVSSSREEPSEEIPLLANVDEVLVTHYVLDLSVDFTQQVMAGSIVLFIEPANEEATKKSFHLCLDSTLVNIQSVSEVFLPDNFKVPFFGKNLNTVRSACSAHEEKNINGPDKTVIEIKDDDGDNDNSQSPDQSDAFHVSSPKGAKMRSGTGLSLFQKLQNNYGIGIDSSSISVNQQDLDSSNSTEINDACLVRDASSAYSDKPDGPTSLPEFLDLLNGDSSSQQLLSYQGLKYSVYGWCVKVNKDGATGKEWPRCICIKYQTSPEGQSLTWTKDQDGRPCVFSPGAYINNRSLMPCQEPPVAMSTWQAAIHVPKGCMVYMSGCPILLPANNLSSDSATHYYEMDIALPCSTLALAAGWFTYREGPSALVLTTKGSERHVPCRVIAVPSLIEQASSQLLEHSAKYLVEACKLLGPYPFDRLDLLILPRCFACMGLKSPNLAFLSQSILSNDGSLRLRVAHEVTHAWFGLLIGAKDWTEEWLSEGFATYLEDTVQSRAENWSEEKDQCYREIRQVLRHRTLSAEMQVTDRDMQCLRPRKTQQNQIERAEESNVAPDEGQPAPSTIIKYKCSKKWTQVHYLKGYFLLIHMENMVGREHFEQFLHNYVQYYQGQLVTSEDFFGYFMQSFPMLDGAVQDSFMHEWLESSGMPRYLRRKNFASYENALVNEALSEFEFWRRQDVTNKRTKSTHAKKRKAPENLMLETSEQIVLMLEKLLQREKLLHSTLRQLNKAYHFATRNAEIRHRWCELIVKHKYTTELPDVKQFLIEDQGMGIYLFGELIISGQARQRALAEEIFQEIGPEMDRCTFKTVTDMLEGVD